MKGTGTYRPFRPAGPFFPFAGDLTGLEDLAAGLATFRLLA